MASSSRRSLFLIVFVLALFGLLGMLFAQKISPAAAPSSDSDIRAAIDGKPTDNMSTSDVADLLKGPKGTTVRITMLREGSDKPLEFAVIRDEIPRYSVDLHFMIKSGIGYMHVSGFQETTEHEVAETLDQTCDLKGLVFDLGQNPEGLLR